VTFILGKASEASLIGVCAPLVCCVRYAIKRSDVDFSVVEGLRALERQRKLVASGASRTMDSLHLTGDAVDLAPYVDGRLQWQAPLAYKVAKWMALGSRDLVVPIIWGGVWDRELASLDPEALDAAHQEYVARWLAAHPRPKDHKGYWGPLDDPWHFQRVRARKAVAA
jgi:peptidoglycan L-alanyl-D-glutamate endopeptidase CwlK